MTIKRGEIYTAFFGQIADDAGSEQRGIRPALIIQNDIGNMFSPTVIVAPISISTREAFPVHVDLSNIELLGPGSKAMLEQIRTIDRKFLLGDLITTLNSDYMAKIDNAIQVSLGLKPMKGGDEG